MELTFDGVHDRKDNEGREVSGPRRQDLVAGVLSRNPDIYTLARFSTLEPRISIKHVL